MTMIRVAVTIGVPEDYTPARVSEIVTRLVERYGPEEMEVLEAHAKRVPKLVQAVKGGGK